MKKINTFSNLSTISLMHESPSMLFLQVKTTNRAVETPNMNAADHSLRTASYTII